MKVLETDEYTTMAEIQEDITAFGRKWAEVLDVYRPKDMPEMQRDLDAITSKIADTYWTARALDQAGPTPTKGMIST